MDTNTIFALRKVANNLSGVSKLNELLKALGMARQLYSTDAFDEWVQKALAYTTIDLCKYYIADKNLNQANLYFQELLSIAFQVKDEIIEKQKKYLRLKIDVNYNSIQQAEELSKNGQEQKALDLILIMITNNQLTELHHETYGWIIYRYIKAKGNNLTPIQVQTFLRDYMNLQNERPSMLHSMMLNFALNYSKTHSDFNFYNFFVLWNPENLRDEDLHDTNKDGKNIPSLISRICKEFVNNNEVFDIDETIIHKINKNLIINNSDNDFTMPSPSLPF